MNEYRSAAILKRAQNLLILHRAYKLLAADAEWDESKHPRAENGRFGSGGGKVGAGEKTAKPAAVSVSGSELGSFTETKELRKAAMQYARDNFVGKSYRNASSGHDIQVT